MALWVRVIQVYVQRLVFAYNFSGYIFDIDFRYLMIILGACITLLIQSSSALTATVTPLVGAGFIKLEKAYPLTLGANIGKNVSRLATKE